MDDLKLKAEIAQKARLARLEKKNNVKDKEAELNDFINSAPSAGDNDKVKISGNKSNLNPTERRGVSYKKSNGERVQLNGSVLQVSLNEYEKTYIKQYAEEQSMSSSEWVRELVMSHINKVEKKKKRKLKS